ncbi:MAG: ABC-F family ATP-binding cassette domain-containing protein [Bernardetiaceae bacterium]|jgi:ATP-binding cassette subfamily F protein uup|nr:ABC-F family ATP-binding cassette domain-containing protein [Bernardetiaceae bacterium]
MVTNLLSADNISKTFDNERWLFRNVSLGIGQGEKVAIVGANGSGKTTLLSVLAGTLPPDTGSVGLRRGTQLGYLTQNPQFAPDATVWQAIFEAENEQIAAVRAYEHALLHPERDDLMTKALTRMDTHDAWGLEYRVKEVLGKLDLHDVTRPVNVMSGGQKKRIALAKLLLQEADLLILDEPTNHLDLSTIEWLEGFLSGQNRSLLLVTHDRYFLDRVCNVVVELDGGQLYRYEGNYGYFLEKKEERAQQETAETDKARNLMRKELDWIRRQPKARGTKAKYRVEAFEDLKEKAEGKAPTKSLELNVSMSRLGNKIIEAEGLHKKFGDQVVLANFSYTFKRGDRVGVIGPNGVGKSTLLNLLTGQLEPDQGRLSTGETVVLGYYTQQELNLPEDQRVIDVVKSVAEVITTGTGEEISASQLLTHFMFAPRVQYTPVAKLSGGEKRRLQLLRVLIKNPNFLILDEPTNDLDLLTLNILEDFLAQFGGCLLLVSHDRYFMDRLVDHLFVFEGQGQVRDFPGNYSDYKVWQEEQVAAQAPTPPRKPAPASSQPAAKPEPATGKRRPSFKEKQEFDQLEALIPRLEAEKTALEQQLSAGGPDHAQLLAWSQAIGRLTDELDTKTLRWLELAELLG